MPSDGSNREGDGGKTKLAELKTFHDKAASGSAKNGVIKLTCMKESADAYRAMLEYRSATAPAAVHETDVELMIVLEGTGNIVTGGKVVDEKRVNDHNLSGPSIADGKSQAVAKGDMIIVPSHTPHQVIPTGGAPIILMTLHAPAAPANWP